MKILIAGQRGQLAREFARRLRTPEFEVEAPHEENFDITNGDAVMAFIGRIRPDVVLNCAAYNLVDDAERDPATAFRVNAEGVRHLAVACEETGSFLVHYSTDYVFNGQKGAPYTEEEEPDPINVYGKSKRAGETLLEETSCRFLLLRLSWVFGEGEQNFLYKMLQVAGKNRELRVVDDQVSIPTSTEEIVRLTLLAMDKGLSGIYHMTASGFASRYEVVRYLFERLGMTNGVIPVASDYFPSPAERPRFSALSNAKLSQEMGITIPGWKNGVDWYAKQIKEKGV
ncbi:MAG: dTDP-4-dehydrorhamnose reductase [Syntrophorhabdales bacterium]|jgi:dTDP-4-dehydrorhamnose reductase